MESKGRRGIIVFMSGHSKWSTIKRQKAANDAVRGKSFSKLSRAIAIAVRTGGGSSPESNYKLRVAIDAAKRENMPVATIERAITKASASGEIVEEIVYEGFGPMGVNLIVTAATDNRNRTAQEIRTIFERAGGRVGQTGSVSFNFEQCGRLTVEKKENIEDQLLSMIDIGAIDVEEFEGALEVYVPTKQLFESKNKIENMGHTVLNASIIQRPKNFVQLEDEPSMQKVAALIETLDNHDDVQSVFDNAKYVEA